MKRSISSKNILITGGAGYIGSILSSTLKKRKNVKILVIDDLSSGKKKYLNCDVFEKFNLCNKEKLFNFFKRHKISEVIHLAGYTNLRDKNYKKFDKNNFTATKFLVENIITFKVKKLIFASTASVYGNPRKVPLNENSLLKPISFYGKSKLKAENYIIRRSKNKFKSVIFRFFNASGADLNFKSGEDKMPPEHLIPIILKSYFSKKLFSLHNKFDTPDGTGIRDYIHVMDLAEGHIKTLEFLMKNENEIINLNLGTGIGTSVLELIETFKLVNKVNIPYEFVPRRKGDIAEVIADNTYAKKLLNWAPKKNINDMCKDGFNWQLKNPNGFN